MNRHVSKALFQNQVNLSRHLACQNPNQNISLKVPIKVPNTQWRKVNMPDLDDKRIEGEWSWFDGFQLYATEKECYDREFHLVVENSVDYPSDMSSSPFTTSLVYDKKRVESQTSSQSSLESTTLSNQNDRHT
jgi:hypothetical protein